MLFHKDVYLPDAVRKLYYRRFSLNYSQHARHALVSDRYGVIEHPPLKTIITPENLIELELNEFGFPCKVLLRLPYDDEYDISIAFIPENIGMPAQVKTVYLNRKTDEHVTLIKEKYQQKPCQAA